MTKLKILHVIGSMNMGGAETMIMNMIRYMDKSKYQSDFFITGNKGFYEDEILNLGGTIYRTEVKKKKPLKYYKELYKTIKKNNYRIVHIHGSNAKNSLAAYFAKKAGAKGIIFHSHSSSGISSLIQKIMRFFIIRYSTDKIACSLPAAQWMYGKKRKVTIMYNPVDLKSFAFNYYDRVNVRKSLNIKSELVMVHVGRFVKAKNHEFILRIFKQVLENQKNARLLLIGEGPELNNIQKLANELDIEQQISFLGVQANIAKYLSSADIFIMPSLYEGFPLSVVEAQANNLPILMSSTITDEVIKTDLVQKKSLNEELIEWVNIISEMLIDDRSLNKDVRIDNLKEFDISTIIKIIEKVYNQYDDRDE